MVTMLAAYANLRLVVICIAPLESKVSIVGREIDFFEYTQGGIGASTR